jgi:peroxiredoxin
VKLAAAQELGNDPQAALASSAKAIATATDDAARAEAHSGRGDVLVATGDSKRLREAQAEYQSAIQLDPSIAEYHLRLAVALMKQSEDSEGQQEIAAYFKLAPGGKYAGYAQRLKDNPRRARENYAPDFQLTTIKGQTFASGDFRGRVVVLDFWATWCPPCRASVGEIRELTRKYPSDKVVVLSVSADKDDAKWREFVQQKNMDWLQSRDADEHVLKTMGVHAFPTYIVIDTEGIIRDRIVGENPQQTIVGRLKDQLAKMLPQG